MFLNVIHVLFTTRRLSVVRLISLTKNVKDGKKNQQIIVENLQSKMANNQRVTIQTFLVTIDADKNKTFKKELWPKSHDSFFLTYNDKLKLKRGATLLFSTSNNLNATKKRTTKNKHWLVKYYNKKKIKKHSKSSNKKCF